MNPDLSATERIGLEALIAADARAMAAESDQLGRVFAAAHQVHPSDFRALVHILVAESEGTPLTSGDLRHKMGLSAAAITYLVERMINSGHVRRESDPSDRRKVILRYSTERGSARRTPRQHHRDIAEAFFTPLAAHTYAAMADLPDGDPIAGHRVLTALIMAMRRFLDDLQVSGADVGVT